MKKNINKLLLALAILCISHSASAQTESVEVVVSENKPAATVIINPAPGEAGDVSADADDAGTNGEQSNPIEAEEGGFLIKDANINDIFQLLAKRSDKQYFHNNKLNAVEFQVTGHLNGDVDPLKQMEELAFQYGLRMYVKGNTVYAMMSDQLSNLPAKEWTYSLNYLRPTDIEQIKALVQPMLSVGRGIVNYEPKTNTIIVIDTMRHIEMVEKLLKKIDKPKGQIVVEVKILRVNSNVGEQVGVDWSSSLGSEGISVGAASNLNAVFGLNGDGISSGDTLDFSESNLILSPLQIKGVLRALNDSNLVTQKSNPVVITEDNEKASISLIDRVPIITTTTSQGTSTSSVSEEVRYTIDASDSTDPETTREIGVTISVTPSLLPDGTIRMHMRPRDMLKVGITYLNKGVWGDEQVIPEEWVEEVSKVQVKGFAGDYSYFFWMRRLNGVNYLSADGDGGQYINVFPDQNMVIVMTQGNYLGWPLYVNQADDMMGNYILPAVNE